MSRLPPHGTEATVTIMIDPVIQQWIAPLRPDEHAMLEASIAREGCRDALIIWTQASGPAVLLDGHHRYAICERLGVRYRTLALALETRDHAEVWVRANQAGRRNLTDDQRAANADLQAEAESRIAVSERNQQARTGKARAENDVEATAAPTSKPKSRAKAAKTHRVSEKRVRRARAVRQKDQALAAKVHAGDVTLKDAERELRQREHAAKREAATRTAQRTVTGDYGVLRGDCFTVGTKLTTSCVRLVFTDPPYHDKTLDVYRDLARAAARVLVPGGSLITYTSHHRMPEVITMLQEGGLTFFWPLAMIHSGPRARMTEYGIVVHWKPLLWFVKGKFRDRSQMRFVNDAITSAPEKAAHPWQQGTIEARYYIEALTDPGDLVFDPFCGGGTTAVAAAQTQRRWLTCDIDEQAVWIARDRVRAALEAAS